jgi:hypothetical protein
MSDLRTAIVNALNKIETEKQMQNNELKDTITEWANDDKQEPDVRSTTFKPTNNVTRETFNAVRDNPGKTNGQLVRLMQARGFNPSSVGSLLTQMVRQGLIRRDDEGKFSAQVAEYAPLKSPAAIAKQKKIVHLNRSKRPYVKAARQSTKEGIAALGTHTTAPVATPVAAFDPEQVLSTLSFPQVLTLYKKIKTLLGEAA